jgi:RimJ/RimL family protein N-acetyltransferase
MAASPLETKIKVKMMGEELGAASKDFLLWRCLHSGPHTKESIDSWEPDEPLPWSAFRERNLPLLQKLTQAYGSCAVTAWDGDRVVGMLRFYPKEVCGMAEAGMLCLQQVFPYGPADDFWQGKFPPMQDLADKTLVIHCIMTGCPNWKENPYQRQGIGTRLVKQLVHWGREKGWAAIEATAYEEIPILYEVSGQAGIHFWEKAGFQVVETSVETAFLEENGFTKALRRQAQEIGLSPEQMERRYTMRLILA